MYGKTDVLGHKYITSFVKQCYLKVPQGQSLGLLVWEEAAEDFTSATQGVQTHCQYGASCVSARTCSLSLLTQQRLQAIPVASWEHSLCSPTILSKIPITHLESPAA